MTQLLQSKIQHPGVWHATGLSHTTVISSGRKQLDSALPLGGWQTQVVYEVAAQQQYAVLSLLESTLFTLSQKREWIVLINPPRWVLDALTEMDASISSHLLAVHGKEEFDTLWSAEQAMGQNSSACVLAWPESLNSRDIKRLKLAARKAHSLCFMFPQQPAEPLNSSCLQLRIHQSSSEAQLIKLPELEEKTAQQIGLH